MRKNVVFLLLFILFTCNLDEITKLQNPTEEKEDTKQDPVDPVNPTSPVAPPLAEEIIFSDNFRIVYVESDSIPSLVYNANARLGDNGVVDDGLTYSLSGDDASSFSIDLQTGVLTRKKQEETFNKIYRFSITASTGSSLKTVDFKLVYLNQSGSPQAFPDSRYIDDSIDSSQAIYAVDLFPSNDLEISYELAGADKDFFRIDNQGDLYIKDNADLRNNDIYTVAIDVSKEDNNSTQKITTIALEVQKGQVINGLPASDVKTFAENTTLNSEIYDVQAKIGNGEADAGITYSLSPSSSPFQIDSNTGKLTLKSALDYETTSSYDLTLTASSQAQTSLSASFTLTIQVSNVQEINGLPVSDVKTFAENTALSTQIYDVNAKIDNGVADAGISYSLSPSDTPFNINNSTGKLTLKSALDYETTSSYTLTLTASSAQTSLSANFTLIVSVTNVPEQISGLPTDSVNRAFAENTTLNSEIYDVDAKIDNGEADAGISYSLSPSDTPFQIDSNTGKLTLKSALDYETTSRYDLTLTASSQAQTSSNKSFTLTINISNIQELNGLPVSDVKTFAENTALNTEIYDINAKIDNGAVDAGISYALSPSDTPFNINNSTGKLTLKSALDYETTSSYTLTLTAYSSVQTSLNASFTLIVSVTNVPEQISGLPTDSINLEFAENTTLNSEIYDVDAKIDNGEADAGISYSLSPSDTPFQIDSNTGKLTLKSALDYETTSRYDLTLTASSQAQTSSNKSFTLTIKVSNVQEINGLPTSEVKTFAENTALSTQIYDINAKIDKGVADTGISYSLAPSSSPFQIDSNTGRLTLKSALDYETTSRYDLTLTASSQAQTSSNKSFTLTIKVSNVQEINGLPVSEVKTFAENTALNTQIYDINAKIDNGVADTGISYSLAPSSSPFQIDSNTGRLTLKSALDYETTSRYDLTLTASSQAQTSSNKSFTLTIKVSNVQEINGLPTSEVKTFAENTALNTQIYDINAKIDNGVADTGISYSLAPSSSPFQIDSNTGKLTLKSALDYETTSRYDLTLTASSQAQASSNKSFTLTIKVSNVQEINGLPTSEVKTFAENTALSTQIYDINAKIDNGVADTGISYSLAPSSSPFQIDSNTGKLTLKSALDYETTSRYDLTLTASSQAQTSSNKSFTLTIKVSNVQEINGLPVSDVKTFTENTALSTQIYDINAKIDSGAVDAGISYSLTPSSSPFQIDSSTGRLTLKSALDYETKTSYNLTLTASSQAQTSSNKSFTLTIRVSNVQEIYGLPVSDVKTFAENTVLNTQIYDINAKIDNGVADTGISYSLAPSSSPFQIDSDTGKLTLKSALDYETTSRYDLTLTASSQAQKSLSASFTLTIQVSNVQEINGLPTSNINKTLKENFAVGDEIYDINAKIDNGVADAGISYSLSPRDTPFNINNSTGKLTLKSALDYETTSRYDLTLTASSQAQKSLSASFTLTIQVSNVQEINGLPTSNINKTLKENFAVGDEIYDINAKIDNGVADTGISYSLAPSSSPFQIDSNTGKLTLKSALDYETTSSYTLTLTASSAQTSLSANFTLIVSVTNVPEQISGLPTDSVNRAFAENTTLNSEIYDVDAKIDNGEADAGISYSLAPSSSPFQIDSNTGKLTLESTLDYETTSSYTLTLTAYSSVQTSLNASFTLIVSVTNVPEQISGLPTDSINLEFAENTALDSEIYDANAKVDNGAADTGINYSLTPSSTPFQIDSNTGKLTLNSTLDYETTTSYNLTLTASSQTQASLSKSFTLSIEISNVQDINGLPRSDVNKTLKENFAVGDQIYDVQAKIDNSATDAGINYSLNPNDTPFSINNSTGKLTLAQPLTAKAGESYSLNINVWSTNNATLQATLRIHLQIVASKNFYLWLIKPDGAKLDTALATTPVPAGYKYEAEVANPELLASSSTFQFQWQLIRSKSSAPSSPIYRKTFSSANGKSYYIPPQKYEDYYLSVQITYGNESKWLFSYAALQEAPSSQDLGISWINKTRNNVSLDASTATIEVGDELSYNLSDWLAYTGLSSVQTEWRVVLKNGDRDNNVPQKATIVLDKMYEDSTVQLGIKPYADETWVFLLKSKVKITNSDEGVSGGQLRLNGRDLSVAGTTLSVGERAVFSDLVDLDGLEGVVFNYNWYLLDEKEPVSLPDPTHGIQSKARSIYLNTIPEDAGKYLMLRVSYTDLSGFKNEYSMRSAEAVVAASNIEQSQGQVVFDRRFQFPKIPLVIKTNQLGERYVWRILESNSQRPLPLSDEGKVISLSAPYADDYGFQTNEGHITLQFEETGAYYVTLEVFSSNGDSQNFISEQLNIQGVFTRGG